MKILLVNKEPNKEKTYKVYVQKRDLDYLGSIGKRTYSFYQATPDEGRTHSDTMENEFVSFEGLDAYHYFQNEKEILDYNDFLDLSFGDFYHIVENTKTGSYQNEQALECCFHKDGVKAIMFPVKKEEAKCLKTKDYEDKNASYRLYKSVIPKLFFIEKEGDEPFSSAGDIPYTYLMEFMAIASMDAWEEGMHSMFQQGKNRILLSPKQEEKQEVKAPRENIVKKLLKKRCEKLK